MPTTLEQANLTADKAAELAVSALQKHVLYLEVVGKFFDEPYGVYCTAWIAGEGIVARIDHGAHSLAWEIREAGREPRWGSAVTRDETAVAQLVAAIAAGTN